MKNYYILKSVCRKIYYIGSGNFWYEDDVTDIDSHLRYKLFHFTLYSIYGIMTLLEVMAVLFGDYPEDERRQSITLAVGHASVIIKIFVVDCKRNNIKSLNRSMVTICESYERSALCAKKYKSIKFNVIVYCILVYFAVSCFIYEGVKKYIQGSHFVTVVTYYPKFEDDSIIANSTRIFMTIVLCCLINSMIFVDGITVMHLVMYKYKFMALRQYFQSLKEDFVKMYKGNPRRAAENLSNGLIEGIVTHKELLRLAEDIDKSLGTVITVQLLLSTGTAVSLLLEVAQTHELSLFAIMKLAFSLSALYILLALFLCNAGEITYQASLIRDSLFYCGWHECMSLSPPHRNVRKLVLLAIARAHRPLVMKAFKMIDLSYVTFLQVVRVTYSVFALFYAQNK